MTNDLFRMLQKIEAIEGKKGVDCIIFVVIKMNDAYDLVPIRCEN